MTIPDIKEQDIDESFVDLTCSNKLPAELKEKFYQRVDKNKSIYNNRANNPLNKESILNIYYLKKFEKVFSNETSDIWNYLYKTHGARCLHVVYFLLTIGTRIVSSESSKVRYNERVAIIENLKNKAEDFLNYLRVSKDVLLKDSDMIEHSEYGDIARTVPSRADEVIKCVEEFLEEKISENFEYINASHHNDFYNKVLPYSRKSKIEDAEVVFFIRRLNTTMRAFLGKPYHDYVATFINLAFDTERDYSSVAQIVRKR